MKKAIFDKFIGPSKMPKAISSFELTLKSRSRDKTLTNWLYGGYALPFLRPASARRQTAGVQRFRQTV